MTSKEKKEYVVIAVMLVATFLVIYFNFLKPKSSPTPISSALPGSTPLAGTGSALPAGVGGALPGAIPGTAVTTSATSTSFLPAGTSLNLKVLDDTRFKKLVPPVYPTVTPDEIGSTNVFGQ